MTLWGVLLAAGDSRDAEALADQLAPSCDGVTVVTGASEPDSRSSPAGSRLSRLAAGLDQVPEDAPLVLLVEEEDLGGAGPEEVRSLRVRLDEGVAAVVRGTPVADALKRVADGDIVGGVDRSRLHRPGTPQLLRRAALDQALALAPTEGIEDPAVLLARSGRTVLVIGDPTAARSPAPGAADSATAPGGG